MFDWMLRLLPDSWQTCLIRRGVALALDDFRRKHKLGKYRV